MANEGIAAALTLDSEILEQLAQAEKRIAAMSDAAEKLEKSFSSLGASVKEMAQGLKGTGVSLNAAFDEQGAVASLKVVSSTITEVGKKASAVKKEFDFSNEINATREKMYELQKVKLGMDRRDIAFTHSEYVKVEQDIESLKTKLRSLLEARKSAFSGDPSKQAAGQFKEYIASLTRTNDGLKKMNAYYKELEKSSARAAKEQKSVADIQDRATATLNMNPKSLDQMIAKLNELKAVKRQLETESKKTGIIDPAVLQRVNTQIANTEAGIKRVNERMKETSRSAGAVRSMLMTAFSPFLVQRFLSEMLKVRGEFELSQKSLAVIIGDATKAQSMFNEITNIAVRSPFSVQDLLKQTKQLAAYRIETDKLIETTKMLGDISAGVGVDMNRLILAYGQVKAAEFLKGTELRQFSEAGVNMLGGLAKRFTEIYGRVVSVGEVMQMVSKRMVKFADVEAVLKQATEAGRTFYKMQEKQADTIQGRISNLNDRIQIMFNNIGRSHDKTIKGIITGLENIISHWQALSALLEPLLGMMMVRGTMGLIGMTKVGKAIREEYALQLGLARQQGIQLNVLQKSWTGILSTVKSVGNVLKNNWVAVLAYIALVLADLVMKANQFRKQVGEIAEEATKNANQQVNDYNKLLDIATDVTNKEQDRQKALDKLKSEFGNILDIQKIELSNIEEMNKARSRQIDLIRQQAYEEARQKAINEAVAESQKRAGKRAEEISKQLRQGQGAGYSIDRQALDLGIQMLDDSDFRAIESHVSDAILNGTVSGTEDAGKEVVRAALKMADRTEGEIEQVIGSLSPVYLKTIGTSFNQVLNQADIIDEKLSSVPGEIAAKSAQPYKDLIKTIGNARAEFEKLEHENDYEANPALKEFDYQQYLNGVVAGVKYQIESGALGEISTSTRDGLMKELQAAFDDASITGGQVEQAIRRAQMKVAAKYGKIGRSVVGEGLLKYEEGQSTADYIKNIDKELKDAITVAQEWQQLQEQIRSGHTGAMAPRLLELSQMFGSPEELQTYIAMIKELKAELGATTTVKPTGGTPKSTYKQDLNTFITTLKNARKEMNKLTGEGDAKYLEKLAALGKKVGINLKDGFKASNEEIMALIDQYKGKLETDDRINLELSLITDEAEHQMNGFTNLAKDLWDRYDNSKKLEDWGLFPDEGTTKEVMGEIMQLENYMREKGEKEGNDEMIKLANELKARRLQIARSEQEEAAKIMYEANKKALDKVQQEYKTMQENIAGIQKSTQPESEKEKAIANQVAKSLRDAADAQWDAYKGSEMYVQSFGDLENMSKSALLGIKAGLIEWSDYAKGALQPTELKAIEKQIKKIDELLGVERTKTHFGAIVKAFQEVTKAGEEMQKLPELSREMADAQFEYIEAQESRAIYESINAQEKSEESARDLADAIEREATAKKNAEDATAAYTAAQNTASTKLNNAKKRVAQVKENFSAFSGAIEDTVDFFTDLYEAMGFVVSDETSAAIDGMKQGFALIGSAITMAESAMNAYTIATEIADAAGKSLISTFWPLLAVMVAIGAAVAILKARDAALEKQVEQHKENVEKLEKAYEKLEKAIDKALDLTDARQSYAEMNANLAKQRKELEEAIAANNSRKQTDKVKEETENLQDSLDALDDKVEETRDKWLDMLGAPTDYQGLARDWSEGWLSAFKETGSGLESLHESFDELYDDLVVGQLWSKIMGPQIENLQQMVKDALADGDLTSTEAAAIRAFKNTLAYTSAELEQKAKELGIAGGTLTGDTLQRGVESMTEKTAEALESILNATRYDVSNTNVQVANIANVLSGEGENTIMSHLRSQTRYLADIARIASAIYYPGGHPKGAGAIKVITEMA